MRPRLLDLFCGAGGAGMGYYLAGFEVVGVDIKPQPNYPFEFHQADAMTYPLAGFDVVHASPPCQAYSNMTKRNGRSHLHPRLIELTRERLLANGAPYVIENVIGAELINPIMLCGTSFGYPLQRHRLFESNLDLVGLPCRHDDFPKNIPIMNRGHKLTRFVPVYGSGGCKARHMWQYVMGIEWTNVTKELAEAIPPYYTEYIGKQIIEKICPAVAA